MDQQRSFSVTLLAFRDIWCIIGPMIRTGCHAILTLGSLSRRHQRSLMAAADLHLLAARLDRPVGSTGDALRSVNSLTRPACDASSVSRRIRDGTLTRLYQAMLNDQLVFDLPGNYWIVDSKGLGVPWHTTDATATLGPCDGRFARGYRLHLLVDRYEQVWAARVTAMNVAEPAVACQLLDDLDSLEGPRPRGLLLADRGYDTIATFTAAAKSGLVMLCKRRVTACSDPRPSDSAARYRSFLILEKFPKSHGTIAEQFPKLRDTAERAFAHLCGRAGGLTGLPPWVRTLPRVRAWVMAKLVLHAAHRRKQLLERHRVPSPTDIANSVGCGGSSGLRLANELAREQGVRQE